jgi:hypothetical protein
LVMSVNDCPAFVDLTIARPLLGWWAVKISL